MPSSRLPQATIKLRPQDQDLSLIQDNLASPVDQLLKFINGLLDGSTSEALKVASLTAAGAVVGATVASGAGFKAILGPFTFYDSAFVTGAPHNTVFPILNTTGPAATSVVGHAPMPFAGSVVGVAVEYFGGTATNTSVTVKKNGSALVTATNITTGSTFSSGTATYAKGANQFVANDDLTLDVSFSSNGNRGISAFIFVELAA